MSGFIRGESRQQSALFPESLDDYISEDNPARLLDAFVDSLDLGTLGFERVNPAATGRPAYHPSILLKIYIYGYLNRIQSSRRLERETQRNIELIWLTGRLSPDFKTIADFRKDNGGAIRKTCTQFVVLCRQLELFEHSTLVIDGSKFKAVNSRDRNYTPGKLKARIAQTEERVARYLDELDRADRQPDSLPQARITHLKERLEAAKGLLKRLDSLNDVIEQSPGHQVSLTDPDARSMATSGKGTGIVGYNVQAVVDAKHHIIVAHEVTNLGHDRSQLGNMARKGKQAIAKDDVTVFADRGYYSGVEVLECEKENITALVPKVITSNSRAAGRFEKRDFIYFSDEDEYECPAGKRAKYRYSSQDKGLNVLVYWSSDCPACPIREKCTTSDNRRIRRWEHEAVMDRMQSRLDNLPEAARIRRQTVEHPFGTLKGWMGATHFLTKTLPRVSTEMSLHVLAYNMKRMLSIFGTQRLVQAIQA